MNVLTQPLRNTLRQPAFNVLTRAYAVKSSRSGSTRKPQNSSGQTQRKDDDSKEEVNRWAQPRLSPKSPTFYTSKSQYFDTIAHLERAISVAHVSLTNVHLLPLPAFAQKVLVPVNTVWKSRRELSSDFSGPLTTTAYRRVTGLLSQLAYYQRIAISGKSPEVAQGIQQVLGMFESENKEAILAQGKAKHRALDPHNRSYTLGRRKTSSARVWIIAIKPKKDTEPAVEPVEDSLDPYKLLDLDSPSETSSTSPPAQSPQMPTPPQVVPTTTVLVNNLPLAEYFPLPADRERVVQPLKVAGVLGAFNVFALVRGGGSTGQSGAIAHGIAQGLVQHISDLRPILRKAKVLRRDPRMVERKKTNRAGARAGYGWVKR